MAALKFINSGEDPTLLVLSADHLIKNVDAFHQSITIASDLAEKNKLITFGIVPDKAETGYGYIETNINSTDKYYSIKSFTEKPSQENAKKYLASGNYLWNSGMFMFKASVYLSELGKFEPEIEKCCRRAFQSELNDLNFIRVDSEHFCQCPSQSIDYAVMEHTHNGVVVPLDAHWSDIGSWSALWEAKTKDINGNVSEGDVILE